MLFGVLLSVQTQSATLPRSNLKRLSSDSSGQCSQPEGGGQPGWEAFGQPGSEEKEELTNQKCSCSDPVRAPDKPAKHKQTCCFLRCFTFNERGLEEGADM